jgi:hypothetical protein
MDIGNLIANCVGAGGNTGVGACFNNIKFIKAMISVPAGKKYPTTSIAAFKTAIEADILADISSQRAYPIQGLVKPTDSSVEPVFETFPDGSIANVNNGFYDWTFQFIKGGLCLSIALQKANGMNRWVFFIDEQGRLYGVDAGVGYIQGVNPNLTYAPPFKLNTGTNVAVYATRVNFSPEQLNVNAKILDFANDGGLQYLSSLNGLQDVKMTQGAARSAGVMKVQASTACGTVDLHDLYATELAVVAGFRVRNTATKKPLTVTAVADDTVNGGWTVTVSASDPNYAAGAGALEIALNGPTETYPLVSVGFESDWLAQ